MSDPMKSMDVEDVLSSIRRLVSEEAKASAEERGRTDSSDGDRAGPGRTASEAAPPEPSAEGRASDSPDLPPASAGAEDAPRYASGATSPATGYGAGGPVEATPNQGDPASVAAAADGAATAPLSGEAPPGNGAGKTARPMTGESPGASLNGADRPGLRITPTLPTGHDAADRPAPRPRRPGLSSGASERPSAPQADEGRKLVLTDALRIADTRTTPDFAADTPDDEAAWAPHPTRNPGQDAAAAEFSGTEADMERAHLHPVESAANGPEAEDRAPGRNGTAERFDPPPQDGRPGDTAKARLGFGPDESLFDRARQAMEATDESPAPLRAAPRPEPRMRPLRAGPFGFGLGGRDGETAADQPAAEAPQAAPEQALADGAAEGQGALHEDTTPRAEPPGFMRKPAFDEAAAPPGPAEAETDQPADGAPIDFVEEAETVIDEDMLRDMIAEMVREELQGELGDRITRNVRKLVRREIQRALASREFE